MNRSVIPLVLIAALLLIGLASAIGHDKPQARPNVVLLIMDEFPGDSLLDRHGHVDRVRYPNFAALADDSTWFRNGYSVYDSTTKAVPLMGPAGTLTIHHARLIHGSAYNRSSRSRRFLLYAYSAVDAWPLHDLKGGLEAYDSRIVRGKPTLAPRMKEAPVRIPLPSRPGLIKGSIYDNQSILGNKYFDALEKGSEEKRAPALA